MTLLIFWWALCFCSGLFGWWLSGAGDYMFVGAPLAALLATAATWVAWVTYKVLWLDWKQRQKGPL